MNIILFFDIFCSMKKISEIIKSDLDIEISGLQTNSKKVKPGDLFICKKGRCINRHNFIDEAIENGASACLVTETVEKDIPLIKVSNIEEIFGEICSKFYDFPQNKLKTIGVTGTDGKTTTATIIYQLLNKFMKTAYMGTNGYYCIDERIKTENTTPLIEEVYYYLDKTVKMNATAISMEVSSEALLEQRVDNIDFDISILTNITEDHLNIHKTIENYVECKKQLFKNTKKSGYCILNKDDKYYEEFKTVSNGRVISYGFDSDSDYYIHDEALFKDRTEFTLTTDNKTYKIESPYIGKYNIYNLVVSIIVLNCLNISMEEIIDKISSLKGIDGRSEFLDFNQDFKIFLDYAHTVNALSGALDYLNSIKLRKIITIVGSAGGREIEKRPKMGEVVLKKSDLVIFTMDDPRYEKVSDIINDMIGDSMNENYIIIEDREEAIKYAIKHAAKNDILFVAGKGRDEYMAINNERVPYSDYEVIKKALGNNL